MIPKEHKIVIVPTPKRWTRTVARLIFPILFLIYTLITGWYMHKLGTQSGFQSGYQKGYQDAVRSISTRNEVIVNDK